jgi:DNA polymerase-3 subunit delta
MTFETLIKALKNGQLAAVYLLHGEEPFFIDRIASAIESAALSPSEKVFNLHILYGRETDLPTLISIARQYPMMGTRQVVILREAQEMKNLIKEEEGQGKNPLLEYVLSPQPSTILVLCHKYKTADSRTRLVKAIAQNGIVFRSDKIYENKLPEWISQYAAGNGVTIDRPACELLAEHLGNDLARIANEMDKLLLNAGPDRTITVDLIERYVGISKEYNVFELQKALARKDAGKAYRIVNYFAANEKNNPMAMVLSMLYNYFVKVMKCHQSPVRDTSTLAARLGINPYFVKEYLTAAAHYPPSQLANIFQSLAEYDLRSKGVGNESAEEGDLLKELTYKILH